MSPVNFEIYCERPMARGVMESSVFERAPLGLELKTSGWGLSPALQACKPTGRCRLGHDIRHLVLVRVVIN
jgi:hypothetical protein